MLVLTYFLNNEKLEIFKKVNNAESIVRLSFREQAKANYRYYIGLISERMVGTPGISLVKICNTVAQYAYAF